MVQPIRNSDDILSDDAIDNDDLPRGEIGPRDEKALGRLVSSQDCAMSMSVNRGALNGDKCLLENQNYSESFH